MSNVKVQCLMASQMNMITQLSKWMAYLSLGQQGGSTGTLHCKLRKRTHTSAFWCDFCHKVIHSDVFQPFVLHNFCEDNVEMLLSKIISTELLLKFSSSPKYFVILKKKKGLSTKAAGLKSIQSLLSEQKT